MIVVDAGRVATRDEDLGEHVLGSASQYEDSGRTSSGQKQLDCDIELFAGEVEPLMSLLGHEPVSLGSARVAVTEDEWEQYCGRRVFAATIASDARTGADALQSTSCSKPIGGSRKPDQW